MHIQDATIKQLQAEIKRREAIPEMYSCVNHLQLKKLILEYVKDIIESDFNHDNGEWVQAIYEATIKAFYGDNFWDWYIINRYKG